MSDIFMSYAREDTALAARLGAALAEAGFSCWWDRDIVSGARYLHETETRLREAKAVVVIWSKESIRSHWVADEAGAGRDDGRLAALTFDGSMPPLGFRQFQVTDFAGWQGGADEAPFRSLLKALQRLVPSAGAGARSSDPPAAGSERASIAVLPFRCLSVDPADEHLAAGVASEIIVALGGLPDLRVAAEVASFRFRGTDADPADVARALHSRFVLTGTLRRSGERLRVIAGLTDAEVGAQIWSRAFDRKVEDLLAVQEEIAQAIVIATGGEIIRANSEWAHRSAPNSLDAWGLLRQAYHFYNHTFNFEGLERALVQARRAVELDPGYAAAHAFLGHYLIMRVILALTPHADEERQEALAAAERAVDLAPRDPNSLENAGLVLYHMSLHERSVAVLRRSVQIAPYHFVAWGYLGLTLGIAGDDADVAEARRIFDRLLETAPDHPSVPYWEYFRAGVLTRQGDLAGAVHSVMRCMQLQPRYLLAPVMLANALGSLGRIDEAKATWQAVRAAHPGFTAEGYARDISWQTRIAERAAPHLDGLRAAGILAEAEA
jgi:TolB-like protein/cytochrome c-type biogenesis protein CcmH/NrfG